MARAAEPFAEEIHYMKVLFSEYTKTKDADAISASEQDLVDIVEICAKTEADVRQTIKELSKQVHELEGTAAYPHREGLHAERMATLRRQIDIAKQLIEEMDVQARSAEQQCVQIDASLREAAAAAQEAAAACSASMSNVTSQLAMYKHITSTTWWPDKLPNIAGTVCDIKSGDIRVFDHDPSKPKFDIVNELWALL